MIASTHITFAEFIYLLLLTTTGVVLNATNAIIIAFAAVLPDIDTAASIIGRTFPFISKPLERRFGHRTLTHSMMMIVIIAIAGIPIFHLEARYLYLLYYRLCFTPASRYSNHKRREAVLSVLEGQVRLSDGDESPAFIPNADGQ